MTSFQHNHEHIDENMFKIEVNLDDMSGELIGHLMEELLAKGANDVYYTPIYMKKNRPGILLSVLVSVDAVEKIKEVLFRETTTFGLRYTPFIVHRLGRDFIEVGTQWGIVRVKQAIYKGTIIQQSPEYEDCRLIAQREEIPLKQVYEEVYKQLMKTNHKDASK
ncbi:nickel insertion protein [Anaerobacillus sp. MEB173]|uniref:nickel insertion protein n=1 Tax=Anaerobacillus sp. MEB173 TaxID=3383345 RepID=UPI003F8EC2A7